MKAPEAGQIFVINVDTNLSMIDWEITSNNIIIPAGTTGVILDRFERWISLRKKCWMVSFILPTGQYSMAEEYFARNFSSVNPRFSFVKTDGDPR